MMPLNVENLSIHFGGLKAVQNFGLQIPEGRIYGLIGPNGAGKTTVFNMLTGVYRPTSGTIKVFGHDVVGLHPNQITQFKMARTFQNIRLFRDLSVLDNLKIAMDHDSQVKTSSTLSSVFATQSFVKNENDINERCFNLLKIFELEKKQDTFACNLPYGDQRRLEIARAMATGAKVLLLDEPAAGMNSRETASLMSTIRMITDKFKMTTLLIEHDMKLVMGICEHITVLDYGVTIASGTAAEIQKNPRVIEAYLGKAKA